MQQIGNYSITKIIHTGKKNTIYNAYDTVQKKPVILKKLNNDFPSPAELQRIRDEFELLRELAGNTGITRVFELFDYHKSKVLVLEDVNGVSLNHVLERTDNEFDFLLRIAVQLTRIIEHIHDNNIIHKDIKPDNILISGTNEKVWLIDFSLSSRVEKEYIIQDETYTINGTLAYISPEQTGRMNRSIDYRTDLYSLGVTLYQMFTGKLPFDYHDPMEQIHAHIAREPIPPYKINARISRPLSAIILKLMAKNAEDRYQSSFGLKRDLILCLNALIDEQDIEDFEPGRFDIPVKFNIPEKLYGREVELTLLKQRFTNVLKGNKEIVFISGESGIGKSSLVFELRKFRLTNQANFISGKFEQFSMNIPYSGIIQAFKLQIGRLLNLPVDKRNEWIANIHKALGNDGQVIIEVIPELEHLIGKQPEIEKLSAHESMNRFIYFFKKFMKVFASWRNPLVFFLDDLQWIDDAGFKLIKEIISDRELFYFLFIGSYRNENSIKNHTLLLLEEKLKKPELTITELLLKPLFPSDIVQLIQDMFHTSSEDSQTLAQILYGKTAGNPFIIKEFLIKLHHEKIIYFHDGWKWDLDIIKKTDLSDSLVALMTARLRIFPSETLDMIKLASYIGTTFYYDILASVTGKTIAEIIMYLKPAVDAHMVIDGGTKGHFIHDRIKEAAYVLTDEDETMHLHYKLGKTLLQTSDNEDERLFTIADQLNSALPLLNKEEKHQLRMLNYRAGIKAKKSAAFSAALNYYSYGLQLLGEDCWETDYENTYNLFLEKAETEFLTARFESAEKLYTFIYEKANNKLHKTRVNYFKIKHYLLQTKYDKAINCFYDTLKLLDIFFPRRFYLIAMTLDVIKVSFLLRNKSVDTLINMKPLQNPVIYEALKILFAVGPAASLHKPILVPLCGIKILLLSLKNGVSDLTSMGFLYYGITRVLIFKDIEGGDRCSLLSAQIAEKYSNTYYQHFSALIAELCINFWNKTTAGSLNQTLQVGYEGIKLGKFDLLSGVTVYLLYNYYIGMNLHALHKAIEKHYGTFKNLDVTVMLIQVKIYYQIVDNLISEKAQPYSFTGPYFDESADEIPDEANKCVFQINKVILLCLFRQFEEAFVLSGEITHLNLIRMFFQLPVYYFYFGLTLAALINEKKQTQHKKAFKTILKKYRMWAKNGPGNFEQKYLLLKAEWARMQRKWFKAQSYYDKAVKAARDNGYINDEAIIHEWAGRFYFTTGMPEIGCFYIKQAHYCYVRWGALTKARELEEEYEDIGFNRMQIAVDNSMESSGSSHNFSLDFDLNTLLKLNQAISGEIEMAQLLEKLIKLMIENTGAQKGALILPGKDALSIEAFYDIESNRCNILESLPLETSSLLSPAMVHYCERTGRQLLLNDAGNEGDYTRDSYVCDNRPQSILCAPIINQKKLVAIIYLENNLTTYAFSKKRLEIVNIICSQAAVTIENIKLIEDMKEKERLKQEMEIANQIQTSLAPVIPATSEFEIAAVMKPAEEVGGDYYDIITDSQDRLWVAIGDVSGHGVTAGLIMMMAETAFNGFVTDDAAALPGEIITKINRVLYGNLEKRLKTQLFMTLLVMKYEGEGRFIFAGAHLDIIVYRVQERRVEIITTQGTFLGVIPDVQGITPDLDVTLARGDTMVIYTDGITEAMNEEHELFGEIRLGDIIEKHASGSPGEIKEAIVDAALRWCNHDQRDDMSLIVLRRL